MTPDQLAILGPRAAQPHRHVSVSPQADHAPRKNTMTLPVHYQQGQGWPVCGERPMSYDSTEALSQVTCPKCLTLVRKPTVTPDQLAILGPRARAFADAAFDMKRGCAAINFDNGLVVYVNDAVPGAAEFRGAVKKLFDALPDTTKQWVL